MYVWCLWLISVSVSYIYVCIATCMSENEKIFIAPAKNSVCTGNGGYIFSVYIIFIIALSSFYLTT